MLYCIPFSIWKVIDTALYGFLLFLIWHLFTNRTLVMLSVSAVLVILYPINDYLSSAGYIATSTNYFYTIIGLLLGITPLVKSIRNERIHPIACFLSLLGLFYAENQDQTAAVSIGLFFLANVYFFFRWKQKRDKEDRNRVVLCSSYLALTIVIYLFMFLTPGHLFRMSDDQEMLRWLPVYQYWPLWYKLYKGVSTTFATLFFLQPKNFQLFCLFLTVYLFLYDRKRVLPSIILILSMLVAGTLERNWFIRQLEYAPGTPDLQSIYTNPFGVIISIIIFSMLITCVLIIGKTNKELCIALLIANILGFGSRIMMGLSPTLYASSFRTFTPLLFCFIVCDVFLVEHIVEYAITHTRVCGADCIVSRRNHIDN